MKRILLALGVVAAISTTAIAGGLVVKDSNGTTLGDFAGYYSAGDGVRYLYHSNGYVFAAGPGGVYPSLSDGTDGLLYFTSSDCTGTPYMYSANGHDAWLGGIPKAVWRISAPMPPGAPQQCVHSPSTSCIAAGAIGSQWRVGFGQCRTDPGYWSGKYVFCQAEYVDTCPSGSSDPISIAPAQ